MKFYQIPAGCVPFDAAPFPRKEDCSVKKAYGNESIAALKGADRVRKRPGVIFGSDGLDGCEHAVFEILSNAIDEAREGYGKVITVTRYADHSIEVAPPHSRKPRGDSDSLRL